MSVVTAVAAVDSPKARTSHEDDSWAIATYLRLKPTYLPPSKDIEYDIQDIQLADGTRSVVELAIPPDADPGLVHNNSATGTLRYEFDRIFDTSATQEQVFDAVAREKIQGVLDGFSCTIFAYGQTGSGKTYTIFGGDSFKERGLIPRSLGLLFTLLAERKASIPSFGFRCQVSFTEIYKETVYDLLASDRQQAREEWAAVQLLEGEQGLVLKHLNVFEVASEEDALQLFFAGNTNRLTTSTSMNSSSSRSHAVFTIVLESEGIRLDQTIFTSGKINLVDLAGSERMYKMSNTKGMIKEAKAINLSLHFLEQVIISLRDQTVKKSKSNHSFIPYRNSVLTNMLRDSLGGNCKSCFLLTINPDLSFFEESVATCRFGQRCGEVKVEVTANAEVGLSDQLKELTVKLRGLERQLSSAEGERLRLGVELARETELRKLQTQTRSLTAPEQLACKACVQELLAAAKESMLEGGEDGGLIEASHDRLFDTVEVMDKSVLVELSTALGGLVQSMFIDRETNKQRLLGEETDRQKVQRLSQARTDEDRREAELILAGNFGALSSMGQLPDVLRGVLTAGGVFIKHSTWRKDFRHMSMSPDLAHLTWRLLGSGSKADKDHGSHPLHFFESAERDSDPKRLHLKGRPGQKSVLVEYAGGATDQENEKGAQQWQASLQFLINKQRR
ncbi:P-loop containing nucleoside triphosphate hydrolase protein [Ochromonadaceae sp. CCMP2298]|nr:P-loop containing nucleoside triphosphate hydrolase protein [Ochromonadaceae sp. CCMP2298]|mmetsp:Transcript_6871/g.15077  ORF Transcript_6871/g.15077 Transcript_6871/m.15077 type:complete len:676 (+) Transcript_6871:320-2347(+)